MANRKAMLEAAQILGVHVPSADEDLPTVIRSEIERRLASLPADDHVQCTKCLEVATNDTPFCPYCGYEGLGIHDRDRRFN